LQLATSCIGRVAPLAWAGLVTVVLAGVAPACAAAATLRVGPHEPYKAPSAAAAAAKNGDHVEIDPGRYVDCAVWRANGLVIEGSGPGVVIADKSCAGKGLFIIDGDNTTVRNLTLADARVRDLNGSGIRLEHGNLTVDGVTFIANEMGILGGFPGATVVVRNSDFIDNNKGGHRCTNWCDHAVYIGAADLLRVEHSRFIGTRQGHSIKSRATRTEVIGCTITDGADGSSSYLIDAPNGGTLIVRDNTLEKGPRSENRTTAIAIGEEGMTQPTPRIVVADNSFRNDGDHETAFVWNRTDTPAQLSGNRVSGPVIPLVGPGSVR
jgi:Right handed beta helix region